jgi:hypothetical protein
MSSGNFAVRGLAAFLVGVSALGGFFVAAHRNENSGYSLFAILCGLVVAAGLAGYFEPLATRVWIHAILIMFPLLVALPFALMTCKGHGCVGLAMFLSIASLFALIVLVAVSFAAFFIRRRLT